MYEFENFSERTRRVIQLSREEAQQHNHNYVGTEHILLGLLREKDGVAARVLIHLGVNLDKVRCGVDYVIGRGEKPVTGELKLTPRSNRVIELAIEESHHRQEPYDIGTEHILLAIFREGGGVAYGVLDSFGIMLEQVRYETFRILSQNVSQPHLCVVPVPSKTQTLNQFAVDLTAMARVCKLDPVIGRDVEIQRVMEVLTRHTKNNPVLIGNPGVGKTTIVNGLAQRIATGNVPDFFENKRLIMLDTHGVTAGMKDKNECIARIMKIVDEIISDGSIVLFLNELQTVIERDSTRGTFEVENILKLSAMQGQLQIISEITPAGYQKYIDSDPALKPHFLPILIEEPTIEQTLKMLHGIRWCFEDHYKVKISDEALESAVILASHHMPDLFLPGKAFDLIEEAASKVRIHTGDQPFYGRNFKPSIGSTAVITGRDIRTEVSSRTGIPQSQLYDKKEK